ncbi:MULTISPECIES: NRAMP family divalent metal transporter [Sinorhizobium]|jgi:NRAMP (natural resistance-associated macrophage protein)-like metal ion transporter|uniref:NRAMP family divalent metal transporter n=1 Tax=Sinorhizobium TaxID=28105 RepID=UPI000B4A38E3|nr:MULTISPECIES: NRAMP family divalent metal transporter [Sinorhizobium]ASP56627.1 divalent metal cation transporter [Sinorhizobium meliloti]RVK75497.1 divalent metal cation transporter [Sinorhizobium meliloti]RVL59823.1 divalent metal cation transporter [Sinorhizobium meliloti]RVQ71507.1 divalent metal cation transporter [Sinorhizobium meliloti]WQO48579.1 NRAMP family divalent metal transporter [Sinorhizobium medicae]
MRRKSWHVDNDDRVQSGLLAKPVVYRLRRAALLDKLGPGLITGAADDDPSGIATYSQAGAQFGANMLWMMFFLYPLMCTMQMISARIGRVSGHGLAANMRRIFPSWVVTSLVALLFIANTINIGADLAAMGAAAELVLGWGRHLFTLLFAVASLTVQVLVPYHRYVLYLKWLTLVLFAYVGVVFTIEIDWSETALRMVTPQLALTRETAIMVVAVFGTTISPYLLFWQASEEVEDDEADPTTDPLIDHPEQALVQLSRIRWDTYIGMAFANLVAFFIILTTALTLHAAGVTEIETSADAAEALRPIAGDLAFALFSLGIIGTGLLAVPILAGSAAYAVCESRGWPIGLEHKPREAVGFYTVIGLATLIGLAVDYSDLDPIRALFWSAVLNGVVSVPLMAAMMIVVSRKDEMGQFVASFRLRVMGWFATACMAAAAITMFILS